MRASIIASLTAIFSITSAAVLQSRDLDLEPRGIAGLPGTSPLLFSLTLSPVAKTRSSPIRPQTAPYHASPQAHATLPSERAFATCVCIFSPLLHLGADNRVCTFRWAKVAGSNGVPRTLARQAQEGLVTTGL